MEITEIPKTRKELLLHLIKDRDEIAQFRDELNRDHVEKKIGIIKEKRVFYQNVLIASATLLGLASAFSSFGEGTRVTLSYLLVGLGLHLGVICIVVMYLREVLDQELEGLTNGQDRYTKILQDRIALSEKYQQIVCDNENIDVQATLLQHGEEIKAHPTIVNLKEENDKHDQDREKRMGGNSYMEFYGEIISFLFITGSAFVLLAISGYHPIYEFIGIGVLLCVLVSFTDFLSKNTKPIFRVLTFLKRDIREVKKKNHD